MKPEAKILALGYAKTAGTESNVVATADLQGIEQVFIAVRNNVGTANDAGETASIVVAVREATDTNGGATSYTTIVSTTELAEWTLNSNASVATDTTLSLSRRKMGTGARFLSVTCNNTATGTASETFLSVTGLMPIAGTPATYSL